MMLTARKVKNLLADLEEKLSEEEEESQNSVSSSQSRKLLLTIHLALVHHLQLQLDDSGGEREQHPAADETPGCGFQLDLLLCYWTLERS